MTDKPIPDGYHSLTPYLMMKNAAKAIDFYVQAFGATQLFRFDGPDGKIAHAELQIGDSRLMMGDENAAEGFVGPETLGGAGISLVLYVPDVDRVYKQAIAAGGTEVRAVADQFYGDRTGILKDPFGHVWSVCTHVEDVSKEEMDRRMEAMKPA